MKNKKGIKPHIIVFGFLISSSCAGPISPFGGIEIWSGDGQAVSLKTYDQEEPGLLVYPRRQVLHKPSDLKIEFNINETLSNRTAANTPQIKVTYNDKDVTQTFLKSAMLQYNQQKQANYLFNNLELKPDRRHHIDIYWRFDSAETFKHLAYLPPNCSIKDNLPIQTTEPFHPKAEYINQIYQAASNNKLNPSLLAGLIAQESGFQPTRVSYAKAVGLTQVTSLADEEIKKIRPEWPRDQRIERLRVAELERLIQNKLLNRKHDWRLDPERAIEGGSLYIDYLLNYWSLEENKALLGRYPKIKPTEVILASYNSGAARVKNKIKAKGRNWLEDRELKEAFKYVNSVTSYCYHFSEE